MQEILLLCLGLICSVCFLVLFAQKIKIAYPIFLVLAGLIIGFIPHIPTINIDPDVVFLIILPPILYDAAHNISLKGLWKWRRIITAMALGFVLFTATAVAFVSHWLIPGFTLAQGFLLGAIISPPDAAAATAILKYTPVPKAMKDILEGESLLNDATSLTIFRFAIAAIANNHFLFYEAAGGFFLVVISGIAIGLAFGLIFYAIYKWLPTTANIDIAFSIAIPYIIYLTAERLHSSGVLAVVSGGIFIAYQNHFLFSHRSRLKAGALWSSIVFILNAVVFFLIGLQLPEITKGLKNITFSNALFIALIISVVVVLARGIAALFSALFTRFIGKYITVAVRKISWRNPVVLSWVGMRGVVSLASALAIPLMLKGAAYPNRNLILFITFIVIIVTLVCQGLTLPWFIKVMKPKPLPSGKTEDQQMLEIELALNKIAIENLDKSYADDIKKNVLLKYKYEFLQNKIKLLHQSNENDGARKKASETIEHFQNVMMDVSEKERKKLHVFRKKDDYDDDVIRIIENRLDLEEERLQEDAE